MQNYETLFVVDVTLGEEAVKALVEKFVAIIAENVFMLIKMEMAE